jgi:hypothetical protein
MVDAFGKNMKAKDTVLFSGRSGDTFFTIGEILEFKPKFKLDRIVVKPLKSTKPILKKKIVVYASNVVVVPSGFEKENQ